MTHPARCYATDPYRIPIVLDGRPDVLRLRRPRLIVRWLSAALGDYVLLPYEGVWLAVEKKASAEDPFTASPALVVAETDDSGEVWPLDVALASLDAGRFLDAADALDREGWLHLAGDLGGRR